MMPRQRLVVGALLANLCLAVAAAWGLSELRWLAGVAAWLAVGLSWPTLQTHQRWLCVGMVGAGMGAAALGLKGNAPIDWPTLLVGNSLLLAMLTALAFLSSAPTPETSRKTKGPGEFLKTMAGLSALGGLINIASMIIVGDRLRQLRSLGENDFKLLGRAYSMVAAYSPFIGGMALCLHLVPNSQLREIWHINLPVVALALVYTYLAARMGDTERLRSFQGFGFSRRAMTIPVLMGIAVIGLSRYAPHVSVLAIISTVPPVIAVIQCAFGPAGARCHQTRSIGRKIKRMGPEAALFMSAGVLAQGLALASEAHWASWAALEDFSSGVAALTLLACVAPSFVGIHPVVPITIAAGLLAPSGAPASMLAAIFALSWAIGCTVNPLSGINLTLQGRYGTTGTQILKWNAFYAVFLTVTAGAWMFFGTWF